MDAEAVINVLLDRLERNNRSRVKVDQTNDKLRAELARANEVLDIAQEANRRHCRDMKAVEAKIAEWSEYGEKLRALIEGVTPKKNRPALPDMPGPLEKEIPF